MSEEHEDDRDRLAELGIGALGRYEAEHEGEIVHVRIAHVNDNERVVVAVIVTRLAGEKKRRTKALVAKKTPAGGWAVVSLGEATLGRVLPALTNALREARELHRNLPSTTVRPWTPEAE